MDCSKFSGGLIIWGKAYNGKKKIEIVTNIVAITIGSNVCFA